VVKAVAADPNAIGFGALASTESVSQLNIKRARSSTPAAPTAENISRRIYPISRYVFCYRNPEAKAEEIKTYLDWICSDEGQAVAKRSGFFPLPASLRSSQ
jgi:ABC-type phosphate transport system substrate-binding protein